jgi:3-isopropylmalate dehydrogenase
MADRTLVAVLPGDGVGPEVVAPARRVLEYFRDERELPLDLWELDLGAERYLRDGTTLPSVVRTRLAAEASAVLVGAFGDPRVPDGAHAREILFGLRFGLDLYANIRPIRALHDSLVPLRGRTARDVDIVVFRENTEGLYAGVGGQFRRGTRDEIAIEEDVNTRKGVERIVRAAFEHARAHGKTRVHMADKSNAMRHAHELWHRTYFEVAADYPDIRAEHLYVDALCCRLLEDPSAFQVIVTCNLFGDILTDLGAALQGGLGMAASANTHPVLSRCCEVQHERRPVALFEPVHGSAPSLVGRRLANPFAAMLSTGMMLGYLGWSEEERLIEAVVARAVAERHCTPDVGGALDTGAAGDWILGALRAGATHPRQ